MSQSRLAYNYPFSSLELQNAHDEWGCNCGPSSLAFALQRPIDDVRGLIPDFDDKRYTSPSMMKAALGNAGVQFTPQKELDRHGMFHDVISLVRIQWTGPWTLPNANPKWAYRQTHWVATWLEYGQPIVYDCNSGITQLKDWECEVVPAILEMYPRSDGGWFPTDVWTLN